MTRHEPRTTQPPAADGAADEALEDGASPATAPHPDDFPAGRSVCVAYVVLVVTPAHKHRRRVFLSLHSASAAVQRAQAKGQPARLMLCQLVPATADLNLDRRRPA
jgi:hypothetical protein